MASRMSSERLRPVRVAAVSICVSSSFGTAKGTGLEDWDMADFTGV